MFIVFELLFNEASVFREYKRASEREREGEGKVCNCNGNMEQLFLSSTVLFLVFVVVVFCVTNQTNQQTRAAAAAATIYAEKQNNKI